jgi:cyclohexadienyl dehydratase
LLAFVFLASAIDLEVEADGVEAEEEVVLRVGTSGDYAPFSFGRSSGSSIESATELTGFDIDIARAFARDRGLVLRFVPFRWPSLLADLEAGRFDVAMSGITVRAERSVAGRFSVPVTTSGAVVLVRSELAAQDVAALDDPRYAIAVNAGGHLERVARQALPNARLQVIPDNHAVIQALVEGKADGVVSDTLEAPGWLAKRPGLRLIGPLTRDRKAYLSRPDERGLARALDRWLLEREADGSLAAWRELHLPAATAQPRTATPLRALLASIDERLALMPLVAEAKRASGGEIEVPEREIAVIDAALRSLRSAEASMRAEGIEVGKLGDTQVRRLFRSTIEAAKDIQRDVLGEPPAEPAEPAPDLGKALRPALIRIGDRIAELLPLIALTAPASDTLQIVREELARHELEDRRLREISDAIVALQRSAAPTQSP